MKLGAKLTLIATAVTAAAVLTGTLLTTAFTKQNTEKQIAAAGIEDFCAFYNDFSAARTAPIRRRWKGGISCATSSTKRLDSKSISSSRAISS